MSRKASLAYFKSRMSTFLNPMFLGSIIILSLLGVTAWQLFLRPNQLTTNTDSNSVGLNQTNNQNNQNTPNNLSQNPNIINNQQTNTNLAPGTNQEQQPINNNILSQTTTGTRILNPITGSNNESGSGQGRTNLLGQLSQLPDLFPELLPNQSGNNSDADPVYIPGQTPSNDYRLRSLPNSSGIGIGGQTPLAAAVNRVMQNNNYSSGVQQFQQSVAPATPYATNNPPNSQTQPYPTNQAYGSPGTNPQTPTAYNSQTPTYYNRGYNNAPAYPTQSYGTNQTYSPTPTYNRSYYNPGFSSFGYRPPQNSGNVPPRSTGVNQSPFGSGY